MITERDISLEDAVRKSNPVRFATWITSGKLLENTLSESFRISRISVSWNVQKTRFSVTLGTVQEGNTSSLTDLGYYTSLEKVKVTYPKLFEEVGDLRTL